MNTAERTDCSNLVELKTDWFTVVTLCLGIAAIATALGVSYPLISLYLASKGTSDFLVSLATTSYFLGVGFWVLIGPRIVRAFQAKTVMILGLSGTALVFVAFSTFESILVWFLLRFSQGIFASSVLVFSHTWLNVVAADSVRGRVMSGWGIAMTAGFTVGPLMVPLLGVESGVAFKVCASIAAIVALVFALLLGRARAAPETYKLSDLVLFARAAPYLVLVVFVFAMMDSQVFALAPIHMTTDGASFSTAATFISVISLGMLVFQPIGGYCLDIWDRWLVVSGCFLIACVMFGVLLILPITCIWIWPVAAIAGGGLTCIPIGVLSIIGRDHKGPMLLAGSSTFSLTWAIGGITGPPISGISNTLVPGTVFLPVMLIGIVGASLAFLSFWNNRLEKKVDH